MKVPPGGQRVTPSSGQKIAPSQRVRSPLRLSFLIPPIFAPGLKEAQDKVNDYSPLMKDFPVNELLAAGSLEAIKVAVAAIYAHLRKIRTTSYPAQRAIYLVEAISRDLSSQLLKVVYWSIV